MGHLNARVGFEEVFGKEEWRERNVEDRGLLELCATNRRMGRKKSYATTFIALFGALVMVTVKMGLAANPCVEYPCSGEFPICVEVDNCQRMDFNDNGFSCLKQPDVCKVDCHKDDTCVSSKSVSNITIQACLSPDGKCTKNKLVWLTSSAEDESEEE
uniref:Uncharacterized protein n=1 Tax=Timema douglasi TaxID=61478 RepID=A0A7R8VIP9_TIMDO|nr:unnamed protein product [Timema douglasi]